MSCPRPKILRATTLDPSSVRARPRAAAPATPRSVPRAVLDAEQRARALLARARREAERVHSRALAEADELRLRTLLVARADALARIAASAVQLERRERALAEAELERSVELGTLLAERVLGEELRLAPERIAALAQQVLREAAGARRAALVASAPDAEELRRHLRVEATELEALEIRSDPSLARGHLRVETELGVIDAELGAQLRHLATQLKKLLGSHGSG